MVLSFYKQDKYSNLIVGIFRIGEIKFHALDVLRAAAATWTDLSFQEDLFEERLSEDEKNQRLIGLIYEAMRLGGSRIMYRWQEWFLAAVRLTSSRIAVKFPEIAASFENSAMDFHRNLNRR